MAGEAGALGRAFVEIHVPVAAFQAQMGAVGASFTGTTAKMAGQSKALATGVVASNRQMAASYQATSMSMKGMMGIMKSALPIMAAFMAVQKTIGIAGGAVEAQREFNKELYQVWTLTDLSAQGIEDLGEEIRGLSYDYNVMAAAGTKAMYQIYSATFYGAEATEILTQGMKAAAAGVTDVMSAVDMTTTVLNAYNMEASESARVNDLLFTAVRFGKTTYSELAGQFGRLAGVAAPAGAKLEEMAAAIATLTRQGIMTDWAVTSLRQTIMSMFRPTGALAKVIKDLGYETGRSLIQQNGFVGALKLVKERADETGTPLENLFTNVRAITAVLPLLTTASEGFALDIERMAMATGTMDIAFSKIEQSWDYRIERLKSQLNDLGISIGETLIPGMETFLEVMVGLSNIFAVLVELGGPVGEFFSSLTGYMAGGAVAAGMLALSIGLVKKALIALAANPIVAVMLGIGAAVGVLVGAFSDLESKTLDNIESFKEYLKWLEKAREGGTEEPQEAPLEGWKLYASQIDDKLAQIRETESLIQTLGQEEDKGYRELSYIEGLEAGVRNIREDIGFLEKILVEDFAAGVRGSIDASVAEALAALDLVNQPFSDEEKQQLRETAIDDATLDVLAEALSGVGTRMLVDVVAAKYGYAPDDIRSRFPSVDMSPGATADPIKSSFTFWSEEMVAAFQAALTDVTAQNVELARQQALPGSGIAGIAGLPAAQVTDIAEMPAVWDVIVGMSGKVAASLAKIDPSNIEATQEAYKELDGYLEDAEKAVISYTQEGWDGIEMLEQFRDDIKALIPAESTWAAETQALVEGFNDLTEGSIEQAMAIEDLAGRLATLTAWTKSLSDAEREANSEIVYLIEGINDLGITAAKAGDRMIDVAAGLVSGIGGLISKFGGEGAAGFGNIVTSGGGLLSAIGAATAVGAGPIAAGAAVVSGLDFIFTIIAQAAQAEAAAEEEMLAAEKESMDNMLAAADAVISSFWSLVESAESVARIQEGLAQLQVNIMSALLGFLWPLASVLDSINGLFVLQEESIKKETEAREKLLSNLNVPIGFPINRIRYGAATPGEPVTFTGTESGEDQEEVAELLEWWQEAMEPFQGQILQMIQPIADFRDAMRQLATDLVPAMLQIIEPILETFGWTLGELTTWMQDVFAPDFEEFAEGFATFWTDKVDPFWKEDMFPQISVWLDRIYGWLDAIIEFFSDEGWDFLTEDVWGEIKPFVDTVLDMFEEFGEWVDENWDDISDNLLEKLGEVLGEIVGDLDTVLDNIKAWLLGTDIEGEDISDWQWLMGIIGGALRFLEAALSAFRQVVDDVVGIFAWMFGAIGSVLNLFIDTGNMLIDALNWAFGWLGADLNHIPRFAEGGIVTGPTILGAGEAGPEAIIPLNQLASMMSMQPQAAGMTGFGGFGGGGGVGSTSATININLSQDRLAQIMLRKMTSANVNDNGVGFAPIRVG